MKEKMDDNNNKSKSNYSVTLVLFALLLLPLASSAITNFYSLAYAQQETGITTATTNPTTSNTTTIKLPQALVVTDIAMGDTQLPLRSSIINGKPNAELIDSEQGQGKLAEFFPIALFHFKVQPVGLEERNSTMKHLLIGPIKSYDSADIVIDEANYWKDIPLNKRVALEIDHPGPHYLIASVQYANGTSGIYSGVMDVSAIGIKPSSDDYIQFQLDRSSAASGVAKIEQSDMAANKLDPAFQQIVSRIICSDLNDNGFEVCKSENEDAILEDKEKDEDDENEDSKDGSNNNDNDDVEIRGDGGKDGKYDINNCTGEQCEDADKETEQERESDYCDIDPSYCKDKDDSNDNTDYENEEENDQNDDKEQSE